MVQPKLTQIHLLELRGEGHVQLVEHAPKRSNNQDQSDEAGRYVVQENSLHRVERPVNPMIWPVGTVETRG